MSEILRSSYTGNVIGIISLLVGLISLGITIVTMKSAKRIEREIKEAQIIAVDKKRFHECKAEYIKKLESKRELVLEEKVLSYSLCSYIISLFNDLKGYATVLTEKDLKVIEKKCSELMQMSKELYNQESSRKSKVEDLQQFDQIISEVLNILKKGEYSL